MNEEKNAKTKNLSEIPIEVPEPANIMIREEMLVPTGKFSHTRLVAETRTSVRDRRELMANFVKYGNLVHACLEERATAIREADLKEELTPTHYKGFRPASESLPTTHVPKCPECRGPMWDNRQKKADGNCKPNTPDLKCQNPQCGHLIWKEK